MSVHTTYKTNIIGRLNLAQNEGFCCFVESGSTIGAAADIIYPERCHAHLDIFVLIHVRTIINDQQNIERLVHGRPCCAIASQVLIESNLRIDTFANIIFVIF